MELGSARKLLGVAEPPQLEKDRLEEQSARNKALFAEAASDGMRLVEEFLHGAERGVREMGPLTVSLLKVFAPLRGSASHGAAWQKRFALLICLANEFRRGKGSPSEVTDEELRILYAIELTHFPPRKGARVSTTACKAVSRWVERHRHRRVDWKAVENRIRAMEPIPPI